MAARIGKDPVSVPVAKPVLCFDLTVAPLLLYPMQAHPTRKGKKRVFFLVAVANKKGRPQKKTSDRDGGSSWSAIFHCEGVHWNDQAKEGRSAG